MKAMALFLEKCIHAIYIQGTYITWGGGGCFLDSLRAKVKDLGFTVKGNRAKSSAGRYQHLRQCFSEYVLSSTCIRITWAAASKIQVPGTH